MPAQKFAVWFDEVDKDDGSLVGGKGANLGEMTKAKLPVPPGFIVTSRAYFYFLEKSKIKKKMQAYFEHINYNDPRDLDRISKAIKKDVISTPIPKEISDEIIRHYLMLGSFSDANKKPHKNLWKKIKGSLNSHDTLVAIRSSATAEDLPEASFAGQQETFLNIKGEANVVEAVRKAWASLFTPRAIFYRYQHDFDHFKIGIAVPVQKMVSSASSGVMFTVDPVTNDKNTLVIEAIHGLGELIVQGIVTPDHYEIGKKNLKIRTKEIGRQTKYIPGLGKRIKKVPSSKQSIQKIKNEHILELAKLGIKIEKHYYFPQDIEWGIEDDEVYILQTRPITTIKDHIDKQICAKIKKDQKLVLEGAGASPGIGAGKVVIIKNAGEIHKIKQGDVLVAVQTNPDFVPAMKKAAAIVTEKGGRTSHAAIVSRELGIPAVVGTETALKVLKNGQEVTVDGAEGKIYKGLPKRQVLASQNDSPLESDWMDLKTATKVYVNLAEPSRAAEIASHNVDGVGLLRAEFMLAQIGIHPRQIIKEKKRKWFIEELAKKMSIFCSAFGPKRPVVYRTTDFKTNEYHNLKYGYLYEKEEENPMLGFRGAFRYTADSEVFEMEMAAIKAVRNKMGLKNLWVMIPFVRMPEELAAVKKIMSSEGLTRSASFKLWMMVELPVNVILLEDFIKVGVDGVSIGSNDLTQLILGVDRDNDKLAGSFNEENPAVLWALEKIIKTCHKYNITCSICGQAASDYPKLVEKLVHWGVTSVSVNIDALAQTRKDIYNVETQKIKK